MLRKWRPRACRIRSFCPVPRLSVPAWPRAFEANERLTSAFCHIPEFIYVIGVLLRPQVYVCGCSQSAVCCVNWLIAYCRVFSGAPMSATILETEARDALSRVLGSEEFRASPNLTAFLNFIVERTLEGREDTIKAYTVATQVLGRPESFDPQVDPIVRVEATRLRRSLERYYGRSADPLLI